MDIINGFLYYIMIIRKGKFCEIKKKKKEI